MEPNSDTPPRTVFERLFEIFNLRNPERKYKKGHLLLRKTERVCALRSNVTERHVTVWLSCLGEAFSKIVWHMLSLVESTFLFTKLNYGDVVVKITFCRRTVFNRNVDFCQTIMYEY